MPSFLDRQDCLLFVFLGDLAVRQLN